MGKNIKILTELLKAPTTKYPTNDEVCSLALLNMAGIIKKTTDIASVNELYEKLETSLEIRKHRIRAPKRAAGFMKADLDLQLSLTDISKTSKFNRMYHVFLMAIGQELLEERFNCSPDIAQKVLENMQNNRWFFTSQPVDRWVWSTRRKMTEESGKKADEMLPPQITSEILDSLVKQTQEDMKVHIADKIKAYESEKTIAMTGKPFVR